MEAIETEAQAPNAPALEARGGAKRPLNVAVVITRLIRGGAQRIALESALGLPRERYRTTLLTGSERGAEADLFEEARARGAAIVEVPWLGRAAAPLRDWRALGWLSAHFRRERFDIVHSHTSKAGLLASMAARRAGVPVVIYSPHGHIFGVDARVPGVSDAHPLARALFKFLRRHAERCSHRVIALNQLDLAEQVALGLAPARKYAIVENGIDLSLYRSADGAERAATRATLATREDAFVILCAGRLSAEKGQDLLIDAVQALPRGIGAAPPVLWLAGDGAERGALAARAERAGIAHRVRFLGMRSDVPRLLAAADAFALPSRYESQGLALMEAMAAGVPAVAAAAGGVPQIVLDGETGLLVPAGDAAALAAALERLRNDRGLGVRLAANGRALAAAKFGIARMLARLAALYEEEWTSAAGVRRAPCAQAEQSGDLQTCR